MQAKIQLQPQKMYKQQYIEVLEVLIGEFERCFEQIGVLFTAK